MSNLQESRRPPATGKTLLKSKTLQRVEAPIVQRDQHALRHVLMVRLIPGLRRLRGEMTWKIYGEKRLESQNTAKMSKDNWHHNWRGHSRHTLVLSKAKPLKRLGRRQATMVSSLLFQMQQPNGRKRWINAPQTSKSQSDWRCMLSNNLIINHVTINLRQSEGFFTPKPTALP